MPTYSIGVCDDDREFARSIAGLCDRVMETLGVPYQLKIFYCEEELLRDIACGGKTDLLFLDIRLGQKNGIDLARRLRDRGEPTSIVLMTVDSSYLLSGYSVQPLYFLMKPVDASELEKAIRIDLKRRLRSQNILLRCGHRTVAVPVESILYAEAADHAITVHTRTQDYVTRMSFSRLLEDLPASCFARCHNSFAVNLARVSHFSRAQGVMLDCGISLPIGRKYFDSFRQNFLAFICHS